MARKILTNNTFTKATGVKLAGLSIGDAWVDPINQLNYADSYLWSAGIVDHKFRDILTWHQTQSLVSIFEGSYKNATSHFNFVFKNPNTIKDHMGGVNIYNFRDYVGGDKSYAAFLEKNKREFDVPDNELFFE